MEKPFLIIVAGGSASGKSTVVKSILEKANLADVLDLNQDDYYKDQADLTMEERFKVNYDHPDALDNELLLAHVKSLLAGNSIEKPTYDYKNYTRADVVEKVNPKPIIIVEGILALTDEKLRKLADLKIFVESDDDIRFIRRLKRDLVERGRSLESVINQYLNTVKPMHEQFVEPSKRHADIIIPYGGQNQVAMSMLMNKIHMIIQK